jgi:hypothetical protein
MEEPHLHQTRQEDTHMASGMTIEKKGDKLVITVDLKGEAVPSQSGKTLIVASTHGNAPVDGTWFVGMNVFRYATPKAAK